MDFIESPGFKSFAFTKKLPRYSIARSSLASVFKAHLWESVHLIVCPLSNLTKAIFVTVL